MCFSAPASFIASGGLVVLGGASFAVAEKEDKILAAIPLLFGIQQFFEGIQWLYLKSGSSYLPAGYGFLFFAFIVWPIYVPTFVYILDKKKRKILRWFIALGVAVALYFLVLLLTQPLAIHELRACVSYTFNFPLKNIVNGGYLLAVFVPLFVSSHHLFKWFGVLAALGAIVAWLFFTLTFASVWCFFAALISAVIYWILSDSKKEFNFRKVTYQR